MVDHADYHGHQGLEAGQQRFLFGRSHGAQHGFGVQRVLETGQCLGSGGRIGFRGVEVWETVESQVLEAQVVEIQAQSVAQISGVISERPGVTGQEVADGVTDVGDAEHRMVGDLV